MGFGPATAALVKQERLYRDGLAIAQRLAAADPGNAQAQRDLSVSYNQLAGVLQTGGQLGEAQRLYRDGLAIAQRLAAADPGNALAQRDLSVSYERLAGVLQTGGQLGEADRPARHHPRRAARTPGLLT